ncbi:MAG: hypothetical protein FJX68_06565 [Alphaproteobacteria bacterium]|nr:hypothetical protein [Alphaproteobacteria bacterium]
MLRAETIHSQLLPTLERIAGEMARGIPARTALRTALHHLAEARGVTYQTLIDLFRRRLGLKSANETYALLEGWHCQADDKLQRRILELAEPAAQADVARFFARSWTPNAPPRPGQHSATSGAEGGARQPSRSGTITLEGLDPATLVAFRNRAQASGKTMEDEMVATLRRVAHEARLELAAWAAQLRARQREIYAGDSTAEIRADRDR